MNEIDLIIARLESIGSPVDAVLYYSETNVALATGHLFKIGTRDNIIFGKWWFFGNVHLKTRISGVINLANENTISVIFASTLPGEDLGVLHTEVGVNHGLNLLGNGEYAGTKKIYQVGFNWLGIQTVGFGAATFMMVIDINGFVFKLK